MVSARRTMEIIHAHAYNELTRYRYNHNTLAVGERYRAGRIAALEYLTRLATHYLEQEAALKESFLSEIERQRDHAGLLRPGGYRLGLTEGLDGALGQYEAERKRDDEATWFARAG